MPTTANGIQRFGWPGHTVTFGGHLPTTWFVYLLLILIKNTALSGGFAAADGAATVDTHRLAKRMDLESCLGQFDVHRNTIIRTGESQALGGKYLQGIELDTLEECQRLCCETESCDVYIFEEKAEAYCYLFECGPPENFHCKFTRHANYTSSVLTTVRRTVEVTTTTPKPVTPPTTPAPTLNIPSNSNTNNNNISQQELELSSLKVKSDKLNGGDFNGPSFMGANGALASAGDMGLVKKNSIEAPSNHCGRFQFTCHSGECIAVYNACDGIPQCEDGSDEGPECSGASSSSAVLSPLKPNAPMDSVSINLIEPSVQKPSASSSFISAAPPSAQQSSLAAPTYQGQVPLTQEQTAQQELHSMQQHQQPQQSVNNREDSTAWKNRKIVADNPAAAPPSPVDSANGVDLNSRIFSHKGGLQLQNVPNSNTPVSVFPNVNANFNPSLMYGGSALQRNNAGGLYLTQQDVINNGGGGGGVMYFGGPQLQQQQQQQQSQQQAIITPQGHILLPTNLNWPQAIPANTQSQMAVQQQQQQQSIATPILPASNGGGHLVQQQLAQGPTYVVESVPQQQQQMQQQLTHAMPNANQQQQQISSPQNIATSGVSSQSNLSNKVEPKATNKKPDDEYEDYADEKSTEAPKKKPRKHKKVKTNETGDQSKVPQTSLVKDPIQLSLDQPTSDAAASPKVTNQQSQPLQQQQTPQEHQPQMPAPVGPPSTVHEQYKIIHENLAMEFRDHDGLSERPGGAVLSLTLGVLITAALAILIGCRMRTVGRRARRLGGKTPYSHEADFLVNGMYL